VTFGHKLPTMNESLYGITVKTINGQEKSMSDFQGKVLLIVNTASKCGFTPQYQGLEKLYADLKDRGLEVLGFPCNQFGFQEPGNEEEIKSFCQLNYATTFPLFSKVDVNGSDAHPLFQYLKAEAPGVLGTEMIKWNFTKFLVDRSGLVVKRFASKDTPESIRSEIEALL
jgi:glutathione peroxidase